MTVLAFREDLTSQLFSDKFLLSALRSKKQVQWGMRATRENEGSSLTLQERNAT